MRVLFVAAPGAGKGTQATRLAERFGIAHLSSGDLLRQEVREGTEIGRTAADYLRRGDLVPDELIFQMLEGPVVEASRHGGYVLDGFPRNLRQAEVAFEATQRLVGIELQAVVHLEVGRDVLMQRLVSRATLHGRSDDAEEVVAHRFEVYAIETEPLLAFYRQRGLVVEIDGDQDEEQVFSDILQSLESHGVTQAR
jgi:adenylate kinase